MILIIDFNSYWIDCPLQWVSFLFEFGSETQLDYQKLENIFLLKHTCRRIYFVSIKEQTTGNMDQLKAYRVKNKKSKVIPTASHGSDKDNNNRNLTNNSADSGNNTSTGSSSMSIFDRLSKKETFASADRKRFGEDNNNVTSIRSRRTKQSNMSKTSSLSSSRSKSKLRTTRTTKSSSSHTTTGTHNTTSSSTTTSSIFDRLSKYETFASADKKGKISRSNMDKTTKVLSPIRQRPVYITEHSEIKTNQGHSQSDNNNNNNSQSSKPTTPSLLSPERNAIAELQLRIRASLSESDHSRASDDMTPLHMNKSTEFRSSAIIEEDYEQEDESGKSSISGRRKDNPTLFNLIWKKHFDAAEAYLNDTYLSTKEMQDALCYQNEDGWNSLMRAFYRRPPKYISAPDSLIKDMIEIGGKELVTMTNAWGDNALICAIRNKRSLDLIKLLIETGQGIEYVLHRNNIGRTALHWACEMNLSMDVIQCLVEQGGKKLVMIEDDNGVTAQSKSGDVMDYLIRVGGEKKKAIPKRPTILHDLIQDKMFEEAEAYLDDEKINLYGKRSALAHSDKDGWTPLMFAVLKNAPDSIIEKMIIIGGSEILSMTNKWDNIALLYALAENKSFDIIKMFIERGGGAECVTKAYGKGLTPLHWACKYSARLDIVQFLINEGEKYFPYDGRLQLVSMKSHYRQVPLHLTCSNGPDTSIAVVKLLLDCDDKVLQVRDKDSKLPLHIACEENVSFDIIKCLVDRDSNKENLLMGDNNGKIPLYLACENKASLETLLYLAKVGGKKSVDKVPYLTKKAVQRGVLLNEESWRD